MISVYFLILLATDISTYLSPMLTIKPPIMDGSTLVVREIDSFDLTNDFKTPCSFCF